MKVVVLAEWVGQKEETLVTMKIYREIETERPDAQLILLNEKIGRENVHFGGSLMQK